MSTSFSVNANITTNNVRTRILDVDGFINPIYLAALTFSGKKDTRWELYLDRDVSKTLDPPNIPSLSAATTGGNIPRKTLLDVVITAVDADGRETPPSLNNNTVTTGASTDTNKVTVTWSSVSGAVSYNVYAATRPGMQTLVSNVVGTSLVITDLPAEAPNSIPTNPDMVVIMTAAGGAVAPPVASGAVGATQRIVVFATCLGSQPDEVGLTLISQ